MAPFEKISEDRLQPQQTTTASESTSIHLVAFDNLRIRNDADIFTLPGGKLIHADRNAVVTYEDDAENIARIHGNLIVARREEVKTSEDEVRRIARVQANLIVSAHRLLQVPPQGHIRAHGYSVRPANGAKLPPYADLRTEEDLSIDHGQKLERHTWSRLVEHLEGNSERELDLYFLHSFGALAINRT